MKRAAQEKPLVKRRQKHAKEHNVPQSNFRKRKPLDCGHAGCLLCHSDKTPKRELTKQEIIAHQKLREQIAED